MKKNVRCGAAKPSRGCHTGRAVQTVQPFPTSGLLADNTNRSLAELTTDLGAVWDRAYSYVVRTVKLNRATNSFRQHGSAPNFQGEVLTLCTCKHQMRSSQSPEQWGNVWLAGFTSRTIHDGKHWLFYLARVKSAYESHSDLWDAMDREARDAKAAHLHFLGDLFKPKKPNLAGKGRFKPSRYYTPPIHSHRQGRNHGWHNDVNYRHAAKCRQPALLVADPRLTFMWDKPMISFADDHCRNYLKWDSVQELLGQLQEHQP